MPINTFIEQMAISKVGEMTITLLNTEIQIGAIGITPLTLRKNI